MALVQSNGLAVGTPAPPFTLAGTTLEGREHGLDVVPSMGCSIEWKP